MKPQAIQEELYQADQVAHQAHLVQVEHQVTLEFLGRAVLLEAREEEVVALAYVPAHAGKRQKVKVQGVVKAQEEVKIQEAKEGGYKETEHSQQRRYDILTHPPGQSPPSPTQHHIQKEEPKVQPTLQDKLIMSKPLKRDLVGQSTSAANPEAEPNNQGNGQHHSDGSFTLPTVPVSTTTGDSSSADPVIQIESTTTKPTFQPSGQDPKDPNDPKDPEDPGQSKGDAHENDPNWCPCRARPSSSSLNNTPTGHPSQANGDSSGRGDDPGHNKPDPTGNNGHTDGGDPKEQGQSSAATDKDPSEDDDGHDHDHNKTPTSSATATATATPSSTQATAAISNAFGSGRQQSTLIPSATSAINSATSAAKSTSTASSSSRLPTSSVPLFRRFALF
ncbi:hypothetical protein BDW59DRAFT_156961 [Aspergillus cavernicola]|uniref:Uncharacterized protein n=1 Tax=Aspergillus cavernicola TaxID=176166 RepID=A0ABR4J0E7_9EURO